MIEQLIDSRYSGGLTEFDWQPERRQREMYDRMDMTKILKEREEKVKKIKRLLLDEHILVHLKSSFPGVDLPEHLYKLPAVTLKLSTLFRGSLEVQDDKIISELLFNSEYYRCILPIDAIGAVTSVSGETFAWTEPQGEGGESESAQKEPARRRPQKAIRSTHASQPIEEQPTASKRPILRRVK